MSFYLNPKVITTTGLVLCLDAASNRSYPGVGSGTTSTWFDRSQYGFNGTLTNGPAYSSNYYGAIDFDGTNDSIAFTSNSNVLFLNTSPYTLEAWVRPDTNPGNANYSGIFDRESNAGSGRDGYNLYFLGSATTTTSFATERHVAGVVSTVSITLDQSQSLNSWHHIVVTYDGSTLKLYRNGTLGGQAAATGNITNSAKILTVGRRSTNYFNGLISSARIYNFALSTDQIEKNYSALRGRYGI